MLSLFAKGQFTHHFYEFIFNLSLIWKAIASSFVIRTLTAHKFRNGQFKTVFIFTSWQILIEGTVGDDLNGDIAIDDLSFLNCEPYAGS